MEPRLIALKLFLDELGIPSNIQTVDDRKRVQKAIYLGQLTGVDLGYRFGWYLMGPYSKSLTRDYYNLAESLQSDDNAEGYELKETAKDKLQSIKPILLPPQHIKLEQEDWLELSASHHYLRKVSGYSQDRALEVLNEQKPRLAPYAPEAEKTLQNAGLL